MRNRKIKRVVELYTVPPHWESAYHNDKYWIEGKEEIRTFFTVEGSKKQFWNREDAKKYAKKLGPKK